MSSGDPSVGKFSQRSNEPTRPAPDDPGVYSLQEKTAGRPPELSELEPGPAFVPPPSQRKDGRAGRAAEKSTTRSADVWVLIGCNAIVFASSVCIMVLELTASRLIAKHVGSSLYTWTSVIGVVLAGITVGNYLGGWLADRFPPARLLGWLFFIASVLSFSVLWLDQLSSDLTRPDFLDWPTWVLCVVAGIFLLPSIALGTISPVVASLALSRSLKTGITVGNIYAWGALGSIIGTFLTGFWLIDAFGSKAIVAITAASLAAIGVIVSGGRWVFRTAVVLGWLQFVAAVSVLATASEDSPWLGATAGGQLHELGLTLRLRDDAVGEYHDESNYSYINVADDYEGGDAIKYLKLDKLIHSYYNPDEPTKLYYDYELVYAAVTEQTVSGKRGTVAVTVGPSVIPAEWNLAEKLPTGVRYDAAAGRLEVQGAMTAEQRDALLKIAPVSGWWEAVDELQRKTSVANWGGFDSVGVTAMPEGVLVPDAMSQRVQYDRTLEALNAFEKVTGDDHASLIAAAPHAEYYKAVHELFAKSRQVSTLFIGGGGFIFPRWIEAEFPVNPRIDVAELDPAVKLAVQRELGLPEDGKTVVTTHIGDARNFVDDRLRRNARLDAEGKEPVLYDFAYGDAFNDFSVPWHLTTREFTEKVRRLLKPEGVYLVNIIDIYPRTEYPGRQRGEAVATMTGKLPAALLAKPAARGDWTQAPSPYHGLRFKAEAGGTYDLHYKGVMSDAAYSDLFELTDDHPEFATALSKLYNDSREPVVFDGEVPEALLDPSVSYSGWESAAAPFESLELREMVPGDTQAERRYLLGFRGRMSAEVLADLKKVAPENKAFQQAIDGLYRASRAQKAGRFLGSYVKTVTQVFPNVYVFSSEIDQPHDDRDTFVIVCSLRPLDLTDLTATSEYWEGAPFASFETEAGVVRLKGQMNSVLEASGGLVLEDDYAPVDNLLAPVFRDQK